MTVREFGNTGHELSCITLGSMRMSPDRIDEKLGVGLLHYLYDRGVTAIHSSSEYENHSYFCSILRRFLKQRPSAKFDHVVKIASPHFDELRFDATRFRRLVERQLKDLAAERICIVQWLLRSKPTDDHARLRILNECANELLKVVTALQREGKVDFLVSFPYSDAFATEVLKTQMCKGLATYLRGMSRTLLK